VVALLGTRYTMEQPFLRDRLGVEVVVPDAADRTLVHDVIYEELVRGVVRPESKAAYLGVLERLGADGVGAGCTEIELLLSADDLAVPFFPTARLHALAAVDFALGA
jgi:aspartate racemase